MFLDIRTLLITNFLYTFFIGITFAITYTSFSGQVRTSIKTLSNAMFLMAAGWAFFSLNGTIPALHSLLWGNLTSQLGIAELVNTIRVFDGKSTKRILLYLLVFITNSFIVIFHLTNGSPNIRNAIITLTTTILAAIITHSLFYKPIYMSKIRYSGGIIYFITAIMALMRTVNYVLIHYEIFTFLNNPILQRYYLFIVFISIFTMTFAFALMCMHRFNSELKKQAIIDPITNLYNRNGIKQLLPNKIKDAVKNNYPLCIAVFDIDEFRKFNDQYGLESGDKALLEMANTLQKFTGPEDIAGRLGGDEFMLILSQKNFSASIKIANDIVEDVQKKNIFSNQKDVRLMISCGVAMLDAENPDSDMLIKNAHHELFKVRTLSEDSYGT